MMFRSSLRGALALMVLLMVSIPAHAQPWPVERRAQEIVQVLQGERPAETVFAPVFLDAVSPEQLAAITRQLSGQAGALTGASAVEDRGQGAGAFLLNFEQADGTALLQLEPAEPFRVTGFRITGLVPRETSPQRLLDDVASLPGTASFGIYRLDQAGPEMVLGHRADEQLAIGSTFKLYVLSALVQEIAAGKRSWADVVRLEHKSLPSGQLQDWPDGTPLTLQTLATLMISISDNTATDMLMQVLGRDAVEQEVRASGHGAADGTLPLLTTAELFALKFAPAAQQQAYLAADIAGRRALLARLDVAGLDANAINQVFAAGPVALGIEWFAAAGDLARLYQRILSSSDETALQIMGINPALPEDQRAPWRRIAYKGGSEPGVLNLSWVLQDQQGRWFAVAASWNNPAATVDQAQFQMLAQRMIAQAGQHP